MKTVTTLASGLALSLSLLASNAFAVVLCPVPDGAGNEGDSAVDMSCWDFTDFASGQGRINTLEANFVAAGGRVNQVAVGTAYGSIDSRSAVIGELDNVLRTNKDPRVAAVRAAVRTQWRALFAINNPAYLSRLGVAYTAANNQLMARAWLPINQTLEMNARTAHTNALAAWNANQNNDTAATYWRTMRLLVVYEEMVGATQDVINGN